MCQFTVTSIKSVQSERASKLCHCLHIMVVNIELHAAPYVLRTLQSVIRYRRNGRRSYHDCLDSIAQWLDGFSLMCRRDYLWPLTLWPTGNLLFTGPAEPCTTSLHVKCYIFRFTSSAIFVYLSAPECIYMTAHKARTFGWTLVKFGRIRHCSCVGYCQTGRLMLIGALSGASSFEGFVDWLTNCCVLIERFSFTWLSSKKQRLNCCNLASVICLHVN